MAEYNLKNLKKSYKEFTSPTFQVIVNGKDIMKGNKYVITDINVELTSGFESSMASFNINNVYDYAKKDFYNDIFGTYVKLGNKVEIKLGYNNRNTTVFKGFVAVHEIKLEYNVPPLIYVECYDVKCIMMNSMYADTKKDVKKFSDAVKSILKNYKSLIGEQKIDNTSEVSYSIEQYYQSDYEFIVGLAKKIGFEFYIVNGNVYFTEIAKDKSKLIEFKPSSAVLDVSIEASLMNQFTEVSVKGYNESDPNKYYEAKVSNVKKVGSGSKNAGNVTKVINKINKIEVYDPTITSNKEAETKAGSILLQNSLKFVTTRIITLGLPQLLPGKFVNFSNYSSHINGDYYINKVNHVLNQHEGFKTRIEAGANRI